MDWNDDYGDGFVEGMKGMIHCIDKVINIQEDQLRTCATQREEADHENEGCHSIFSQRVTYKINASNLSRISLSQLLALVIRVLDSNTRITNASRLIAYNATTLTASSYHANLITKNISKESVVKSK
jgi:hypothetical protein